METSRLGSPILSLVILARPSTEKGEDGEIVSFWGRSSKEKEVEDEHRRRAGERERKKEKGSAGLLSCSLTHLYFPNPAALFSPTNVPFFNSSARANSTS